MLMVLVMVMKLVQTKSLAALVMDSVSTYCVDSKALEALHKGGLQAGWMQTAAAPYHIALCNVPALQQLQAAAPIICYSRCYAFELNSKALAC